jgi:hypothetical protein
MKDLEKAMAEEQAYLADKFNYIDTNLSERLAPYGYSTLREYFKDKQAYLFNEWKPQVYYVDVTTLTTELEKAVQNNQYGIYVSTTESLYAFHGSDDIDYDLCNELGITVAELYYKGGTIIGGVEDLGIEVIAPRELGLTAERIIYKFYDFISKHEPSAEIVGNDILVNGEKILGSMSRLVGNSFVWAAQISFEDHEDIIKKVCNKKSKKKPGRLKNSHLNKKFLEREVLKWLQKQ